MKELLFLGYFKEVWQELAEFLTANEYKDEAFLKHLKEVLEGTEKKR